MVEPGGTGTAAAGSVSVDSFRPPAGEEGLPAVKSVSVRLSAGEEVTSTADAGSTGASCGLLSDGLSPGSDTSIPPAMDVVGPGGVGESVAGSDNVNSFRPSAGKEAAGGRILRRQSWS